MVVAMTNSWLLGKPTIGLMTATYLVSLLALSHEVLWWVAMIGAIAIGWRWCYSVGKVMVFNRYLLSLICVAGLALLAISVTKSGLLITMINLLLLGYGLKFIELKQRRDVFFLVLVGILTVGVIIILYSDVLSAIKILPLIGLNIAILSVTCAPAMTTVQAIKQSAQLIAISVPLTVVLFLLMPKLPPLWDAAKSQQATTGLSDELSPGDIAELSRSDALAFSVTFDPGSQLPLRKQLYWRALVMDVFDGQRWRQSMDQKLWQQLGKQLTPMPPLPKTGGISYQVITQPTQQSWMVGLALPINDESEILRTPDQNIYATSAITATKMYRVTSYPSLMSEVVISDHVRQRNLTLVNGLNQQTKQWAIELRRSYPSDQAFISAVLSYFNQQQFYYTLSPPLLGENSVDDFMFGTRRGFCAHYASAFTVIMRAAGIPSRIVAGYQGGEWNSDVGYLNVYQYDAHAWSEVWLPAKGWVRQDPTASVSPLRIEQGLAQAMATENSFLSGSILSLAKHQNSPWLNNLRLSLANLNYFWDRWLLGYDKKLQYQLLNNMLGGVTTEKVISLTISCFVFIGLWLMWNAGFKIKRLSYNEKIDSLYLELCDELAKVGVRREKHVASQDYAQIIATRLPHAMSEVIELTEFYNNLNYASNLPATKSDYRQMKRLIKSLLNKI